MLFGPDCNARTIPASKMLLVTLTIEAVSPEASALNVQEKFSSSISEHVTAVENALVNDV